MAPPRCGVENCRSRKYEEGEDGYLYCENGHRKGEMIAGEDDDHFETAIRRTTRKKVDEEEREHVYKYYRGAKGFDLYIKCVQLVLRHQLAFLIQKKGLPAELETVVQDLWMLRILQLGNKIRNESQELVSSQTFSTQETKAEAEDDPLALPSRKKKLQENPNLIDCLSLCYLGIVTLRLPVTPGDIYTWTTEEDMPYMNSIRYLSPAMKTRLPPTYHSVFIPQSLLSLRRFYSSVANIHIGMEQNFSITWPPLNVPILLFRYLKELALPLELYDATIRLGEQLEYDFALNVTPRQKLHINILPEARLMSCLVICVKLIFPFDNVKRYPRSLTEPTATAMDWAAWSRLMQETKAVARGGEDRFTTEELTKVEEKDVFFMSNDQLDQYLDFYLSKFLGETHLQSNRAVDDFHAAMYDMFPVTSDADIQPRKSSAGRLHNGNLQLLRAVHGTARAVGEIPDDDDASVLRPGTRYAHYKKESELPDHARQFFEEAARLAGLTMDMLVRCVGHIERKIVREQGRKQKAASQRPVGDTSEAEAQDLVRGEDLGDA
ncbi:hypothetical protein BU23DRAFT_30641 [Bimuria novae-zelandiae CBS 107.79]|uniref:RRN7-type domain-containing protein n=1 Tax=Bimuria novae-zelandiae CBS 107.79 TaxID=1447943 RepID=A0A6A5VGD7_9PLEO|nr:hypothetical protein BU23DRAFT_30641 [Bimuria novae-zelandiae CBS 107.79]